ncbi:zinc finger CCHC domain-containing protein 4 [Silurus asotus]|uniref:Zinc finger CCHC domain-containing protein 4 n=1 Tax=Silurus asotus TaxID=30991 RepID=A0AAD5AIW8_SILAS|nr:zinc finger CCHC domain-containing protein 4 [Silurus asotus]
MEQVGEVEVIIPGPTVLFQVMCRGEKSEKRFYACSACRDRKDCSFFQWEKEKISEERLHVREEQKRLKKPPFTHSKYCTRFREFVALPLDQRSFCVDCQQLLLPAEQSAHASHQTLSDDITVARLRRPSLLLRALENKKSNAQYLFADRSCHFLLDVLSGLRFNKVLCVGTPRLHELIKIRSTEDKTNTMKSLLLDIDFRYSQFHSQSEFCHYNMFNHHFFDGKEAADVFQHFLTEEAGNKVVMVADPPFGGLVKLLGHTFSKISQTWRDLQGTASGEPEMPMVWIFPYFFEPRILDCFPSFTMLDYQVDYDNHPLYKLGSTGRKQSPVRLFTNICPKNIVLPQEEGYKLCSICERYVSAENRHCPDCNACTSKNGRPWRHCAECGKCVKPSWRHCSTCGRCVLPDHRCGQTGCYNCGDPAHKHKACPLKRKKNVQSGEAASRRYGNLTAAKTRKRRNAPRKKKKKKKKVT